MKFFIGVTDSKWFEFLADTAPDEVNFWRPSGRSFRAIEPGALFLFKLHSPLNVIAGGGFFVRYSLLPLSLAWETFGQKNGAPDYPAFHNRIHRYRSSRGKLHPDPQIGCIVLVQPFFFAEKDQIPVPEDWSPNIVQGKTYDPHEGVGAKVWAQVQERLARYDAATVATQDESSVVVAEERMRYGSEYTVRPRLGQGAFRVVVTEAYCRRCAISGERTLPVLQASHIKPYSESGPHRVENGILLRADLHILLDKGYITLTDDLQVEVSRRIKEDFHNGDHYYSLHGSHLAIIPPSAADRPSLEFVQWHNQNRFLG